ncbi:hypothetical protein BH11MYX3_BH11MYX3_42760 [soil metagenome]
MTNAALSERREQIIERLSTDYAEGSFEVEELERRLSLVHAAETPAELEALAPSAVSVALVPSTTVRIVMGSVERTGPWTVPQQLAARVVCGSLVLDLREARLAHGVTTIDVNITMGSVEVIVPPWVSVEAEGSSFLGSIELRTEPFTPTSDTPVVRITGRVKLGNLEVATMRPGETQRDVRWRRRHERRWRRDHRTSAHR